MKLLTVLLLAIPSVSVLAAGPTQRLNKNGVALCEDRDSANDGDCYDAVSYSAEGKAVKAGPGPAAKFRAKFRDATYVFASQDHLDRFNKTPDKFLPEFGGWCAYAVAAKSEKVDVDPRSFHIQNGRLLLFYDGTFADTRKTWLNDKKKDPPAYLKEADQNWPAVQTKEP